MDIDTRAGAEQELCAAKQQRLKLPLTPEAPERGPRSPLGRGGETCSAGPAVVGPPILMADGSSSDAGSCRVANRTIRFRLGPTPNTVSENVQAAPPKSRRGGEAARLESEPCATFLQRRGFLPRHQ